MNTYGFFDFIWHFISFPVRKFWKKISFLCCILADISVSNLVSGVQYTVTNAICCKISLMYNSLVCKIIVLRTFVSWMCECVTKNKIKSIVVSKADYSCIWFLNSGIITTELSILRIIPTKFQLNPFSGFEGVVSSRFEFNRHSRLGAVMQKLSN